jgi:uncharacterized protein YqfB (UPF0267 family)
VNGPTSIFSDLQNISRIRSVARALQAHETESRQRNESLFRLGTALEIIASNPDQFDKFCAFNIAKIGNIFISTVSEFRGDLASIDIPRLTAFVFRFISEFDLSISNDLSMELQSFLRGVVAESENYSDEWRANRIRP